MSAHQQNPPGALTLYQLAAALQNVVDEQFAGTHLLVAEIASLSDTNARGHCYLELLDKDPATGQECRMRATIWATRYRVLAHYFLSETGQRLSKGLQILFQAELAYHPTYGLSLNITEIDAGFTLGRQQLALEKILAQLTTQGLLALQQNLTPPPVLQNLAIISSPSAAGYQDFVHQLEANTYRYAFTHTLYTAIMQGAETETSILRALEVIARQAQAYDAVVLIRGGGADQDLMGFNTYALGKALAQFPLPVLTGIGHERDNTVPDRVAYRRLKTPTAVAEYLIERAATFEQEIDEAWGNLTAEAQNVLLTQQNRLASAENSLLGTARALMPAQHSRLATLAERVAGLAQRSLTIQALELNASAEKIRLLDPRLPLKRGYALVYKDTTLLRMPTDIKGEIRVVLEHGQASGIFTPQKAQE